MGRFNWNMALGMVPDDGIDHMHSQMAEIEGFVEAELVRDDEWVMRDGTIIRITAMKDGHLTNTIRFLRRNAFKQHPTLVEHAWQRAQMVMGSILPTQAGEMAESLARALDEDGWEGLLEGYGPYENMVEELEARGLPFPEDDFLLDTPVEREEGDWFWTGSKKNTPDRKKKPGDV